MTNGFIYCWSDLQKGKVYVGLHKGTIDDGYICSSKTMLEEYKNRKDDFSRQILFAGDYNLCAKYEVSLILALFKTSKETYYNRSAGKKILIDEEIKKKISLAKKGKKMSEAQKKLMSELKKGNTYRRGKKCSEESRKKMSISQKGRISPNKGKTFSDELKKKLSNSAKNKPPITDEHRKNLSIAAKEFWRKRKGIDL